MIDRGRWSAVLLPLCVALLASGTARAQEPLLVGIEASAVFPLAPPQVDRFLPGAAAAVSLHYPLADAVLIGARLRGGFLGDGAPPADLRLADPGVGDVFSLHASVRLRPAAPAMGGPERGTGPWIDLGGGGTLTGGNVRPSLEGGLGWAFALGDVDLGPAVRYEVVFETESALDRSPAHLLLVGVELTLGDRRAAPPPPVPEADRDVEGRAEQRDRCPGEPEDEDGFEDEDGCPDPDNDRDGILDADDRCPLRPEDEDGFEDEDGCPDPDNDGDGFLDGDDQCPNEAEVVNGVEDEDGCPDEGLIELVDDRIVLEETVLFDFNRARVKHAARPTLRAIVELVRQHPEWARFRVEGHADIRGSEEHNMWLSELRAQRVRRALIEMGLPAEMIEARGFGATRLRDQRTTEAAHQRNRRVEFVVAARRRTAELSSPVAPPAAPAPDAASPTAEEEEEAR